MKCTFSILILLSFLLFSSRLQANDCGSAAALTIGSPTPMVFDGCDNGDLANGIYPCNNCNGDAWFELDLGGTNLIQQHVRFNIEANGSAQLNLVLMYSDSWEESGDVCTWSNAGGSAVGLSRNVNVCGISLTGIGDVYEFESYGLDGSGKYVLLVEKTTTPGTANTVTVTPVILGTCNAPSNDRCASPLALSSGNGIDPAAPAQNVPAWSDAMKSSNSCATKQRITRTTPGNPGSGLLTTEDHYSYRPAFQARRYTGNLGDVNGLFGRDQADTYLENTVFYSFQVTQSANDWKLAIGNSGQCNTAQYGQEPNNIVAMVFSSLDCNDAENSNRIATAKFDLTDGLAAGNPEHIFGLNLNTGQTYYLVMEGTRGSQCNFCLLLYRGNINPVLPAEIDNFQGYNQGSENILTWESIREDQHNYFGIEKSLDGEEFEEIAKVYSQGDSEVGFAYQFTDTEAKVGKNYYRLNMVDADGTSFYSNQIEVFREAPETQLISLFPNPAKTHIELLYHAETRAKVYVDILDVNGRKVKRETLYGQPGEQSIELDISALSAGIYIVRFQLGTYTALKKLIKQ